MEQILHALREGQAQELLFSSSLPIEEALDDAKSGAVFDEDVLECAHCHGRMKLVALVTEPQSVARYLSKLGEPLDVPGRTPSRGLPYWKSRVLRQKAGAGRA